MEDEIALADGLLALGLAQGESGDTDAGSTLRAALRLARKRRPSVIEPIVLAGLAVEDLKRGRHRTALRRYSSAADLAHELGDVVHEAESVAAVAEIAATVRDTPRSLESLQRLIDLVQQQEAPLDHALVGITRIGDAWYQVGDIEGAAGVFAAGIVLAAAEGGDPDREDFWRRLGRAAVAPFVYANARGVPTEPLEQALIEALRANVGRRFGVLARVVKVAAASQRAAASRRSS